MLLLSFPTLFPENHKLARHKLEHTLLRRDPHSSDVRAAWGMSFAAEAGAEQPSVLSPSVSSPRNGGVSLPNFPLACAGYTQANNLNHREREIFPSPSLGPTLVFVPPQYRQEKTKSIFLLFLLHLRNLKISSSHALKVFLPATELLGKEDKTFGVNVKALVGGTAI